MKNCLSVFLLPLGLPGGDQVDGLPPAASGLPADCLGLYVNYEMRDNSLVIGEGGVMPQNAGGSVYLYNFVGYAYK